MKIATWNVNSIRVRADMVLEWAAGQQPDVLCLQEIKVTTEDFPKEPFVAAGYQCAVSGQRAYNGVAILSRQPLEQVEEGFPDYDAQGQKRLIAATVGGIRVVNVYVPNGEDPSSDKFTYKLEFFRQLRRYLEAKHRPQEPLVLLGDFNVAPEPIDVYDAEAMEGKICYHPLEREAFAALTSWGLTDVFRKHVPEGGHYSWWDYRAAAFRRNLGLRIDHILATAPLAARSQQSGMDREMRARERPSDHIPVWAIFAEL